jgi:hypothetical protein
MAERSGSGSSKALCCEALRPHCLPPIGVWPVLAPLLLSVSTNVVAVT